MAEKAELLWPRLPRKLGRGQACQALPGRIFLVSLAKNLESQAWAGFARLAGFLTGLLMHSLVYGSPEAWLKNERWRSMLHNDVYSCKLCAIAVDEAHVLRQW